MLWGQALLQLLTTRLWPGCRWLGMLGGRGLALVLAVMLGLGGMAPAWAEGLRPGQTSIQPYLDRFTEAVTQFTLANGMTFIVLERPQAPVVSFMIHADVGAVDEEDGKTGVAHYLEHLAFKGTSRIGTLDHASEVQVLAAMDRVFAEKLQAEAAGNANRSAELKAELEALRQQASSYVVQNQYGQIIEQAGGVGLNATTGADATRYFYSLPANKLELWFSLESERFLDPVFREFFEEKDVILEERQMRVDNSPVGTLVENFLENAFEQHPYRRPIIGYEADLYAATRQDIQDFYDTYYGPGNLTAVVVGDVNAAEVKRLAEVYFGRYPARPTPPQPLVNEPPQTAPRNLTLELPSEPWYIEGYPRPSLRHPDHVIYDMIDGLLTSGRTSRLYRALVVDNPVALDVGTLNGFPGNKYDNLFGVYGLTAPGHSPDDIAILLHAELERLQREPVSQAELDRVKTQSRAGLLRSLNSNSGLASLLAEYQAKTGDWRNIFRDLDAIEQVTTADVQRVAQSLFQAQQRTAVRLLTAPTQ
ncbi:peptidase M16 [Leptolyngbya sp. BL0902]|nr:peptidase M16 [Leptolyngbya sp. BL0902]